MKKLLLTFHLVLSLLLITQIGNAQQTTPPHIYPATLNDLSATVASIYQVYGAQSTLLPTDIETYVATFLTGTDPNCPPPIPQIDQIGGGIATFSWPANPIVGKYEIFYLNLNSAANGSTITTATNYTLNAGSGLYLVGFTAICPNNVGGDNKGVVSNLIIVDVDVLFPPGGGDGGVGFCVCSNPSENILYNGGNNTSIPSYFWGGTCNKRRYQFKVQGIVDNISSYSSELTVTFEKGTNHLTLAPLCDINALSQVSPLHVGALVAEDYYRINFTSDLVAVEVTDDAIFNPSLVQINSCSCLDDGPSFQVRQAAPEVDFLAFPNPTSGEVLLQYHLPETGMVELNFYDALGRQVSSGFSPQVQMKGNQLVRLELSHLPKGIYTCQLINNHTNESLLIQLN